MTMRKVKVSPVRKIKGLTKKAMTRREPKSQTRQSLSFCYTFAG